jgi:hypothetical protein
MVNLPLNLSKTLQESLLIWKFDPVLLAIQSLRITSPSKMKGQHCPTAQLGPISLPYKLYRSRYKP